MRHERRDSHQSQISTIYCLMEESVGRARSGSDPRTKGMDRLAAIRSAMDLIRLAHDLGLPRLGSRATGELGEVQAAFARGWSKDPELARAIFDVVTDLPPNAFEPGEIISQFAQRLFGVQVKGEQIVPLYVPPSSPGTVSIGNGTQ